MSLADLLCAQKPRDTSGALSSDRFEYQRNWALCKLLFLHQQGDDYVMTFDHHEDVTVLDAEVGPQKIQGYQIKTKSSGTWSVAALVKRPPGQDAPLPSILGKLCDLCTKFPGYVELLQLVSNAPLSAKLGPNSTISDKKNIKFADLAPKEQKVILDNLKTEFDPNTPPAIEQIFEFEVSELSLADHAVHAKGKLTEALDVLFPNQSFPINAVYRALLGEITARNNNREDTPFYKDILAKKSISRSRFSSILETCGVRAQEPSWTSAEAQLHSEGASFKAILALKNEWQNAILDRFQRRDTVHLRFLELIREASVEVKTKDRLIDALKSATADIKKRLRPEWTYGDTYIEACILVHVYES